MKSNLVSWDLSTIWLQIPFFMPDLFQTKMLWVQSINSGPNHKSPVQSAVLDTLSFLLPDTPAQNKHLSISPSSSLSRCLLYLKL